MRKRSKKTIVNLLVSVIILLSFWSTAIILWRVSGKIFYLFNFGYIGAAIGVGIGLYTLLPKRKKPIGRRVAQLLVGTYLLVFLGLLMKENMQIEGFFFHLLTGFFASSVIHYLVAKFSGPLIYGRAYCSWACWTAMILDLLPHKRSKKGRAAPKWGMLRYAHFCVSLLLILILWFLFRYRPDPRGQTALLWMVGGNIFYYLSAIILAYALKDNRAFCKYLCPITTIIKSTSRFALLKIEGDKDKCIQCGAFNRACPMGINIMEYVIVDARTA